MILESDSSNKRTYIHEGILYEIDDLSVAPELAIQKQSTIKRPSIQNVSEKTKHHENAMNYRIDEYGNEWILKENTLRIKGLDTGLCVGKKWFRVSDRDERGMFWITSLLGIFGIHKLLTGEIKEFFIYLFTCGGFGMLVGVDVLGFMTGDAGYDEADYIEDEEGNIKRQKERIYYRKLKSKWIVPAGLICLVTVTFISARFIYKPVMMWIGNSILGIASGMNQENIYERLKIVGKLQEYRYW